MVATSRSPDGPSRAGTHPAMRDLYSRLAAAGYDPSFVRAHVLPDWWEDSLAENPANRAMGELAIARMLGFDVPTLHDRTAPLPTPGIGGAKLKHSKDAAATQLAPAIRLAERAVNWLLPELREVPSFAGTDSAQAVREGCLAGPNVVDLVALVEFPWTAGVPSCHLSSLPKRTKKLDGLAMVCGATPAVVLASRRDSPPWLAFHLAHELAHVFLGHVRAGQPPLIDGDLSSVNGDEEEREADEFA